MGEVENKKQKYTNKLAENRVILGTLKASASLFVADTPILFFNKPAV